MSIQWWLVMFIMVVGIAINFVRLLTHIKQQGIVMSIGTAIYTIGGVLMLLSIVGLGIYIGEPISNISKILIYGIGLVGGVYVIMSAYVLLHTQR